MRPTSTDRTGQARPALEDTAGRGVRGSLPLPTGTGLQSSSESLTKPSALQLTIIDNKKKTEDKDVTFPLRNLENTCKTPACW